MPIRIDCHQHFWTLERDDYGWLTPEHAALYRDFLPSELAPLLDQSGVQRTVLVQAAPTIEETRYLLSLAERHAFIAAVVGWVDMNDGSTSVNDLEALAQNPYLRGIRPMIQDIPDPSWMLRPSLDAPLLFLADRGLCFDALVKPVHLTNLLTLLTRHPDLTAVVDHCGKPDIAGGQWDPWAGGIRRIAQETPAYCKISGLITETDSTQSYADLRPYMDHVLEHFGPARVMWGSDWPVVNTRGDYAGWVAATRQWLSAMSDADRRAIEGANAARFYGIASDA